MAVYLCTCAAKPTRVLEKDVSLVCFNFVLGISLTPIPGAVSLSFSVVKCDHKMLFPLLYRYISNKLVNGFRSHLPKGGESLTPSSSE